MSNDLSPPRRVGSEGSNGTGGSTSDSVRFKCSYGPEKRILFMPRPVRFEVLRERVASLFKRPVEICCRDEGGLADLIPIQSQPQLDSAIAVFDAGKAFSLQLFLTDNVEPDSGVGPIGPGGYVTPGG